MEELDKGSIKSLLWKYAIPSIIGTAIVAVYNIIDSIYIGFGPDLGDHAIGGLGIVLPIMNLLAAFGMLIGVGASTFVSIHLGKGDKEKVERIIGCSFLLSILIPCIIVIPLLIFIEPLLYLIGATNDTYRYAHEFIYFYLPGSIFLVMSYNLNSILRAIGFPKESMRLMFLGIIINIALAPVFIFIFKWGMAGAAMATNISILISFICTALHFRNTKKNSIILKKENIRLDFGIVRLIFSVGISPFLMQVAASVVVFFINGQLKIYGGSVATEAYAIANRITMLSILILSGLTQGMQPIIGYNYGAGNHDRVIDTLKYTIIVGIIIGGIGTLLNITLSDVLVKLFNPTDALAVISAKALRILSIMLSLSAFQMVISNYFQSIGQAYKSIIVSLSRQIIILIPLLFLLPEKWGLDGVWFSIPLSDFLSTILALLFLTWSLKTEVHKKLEYIKK